MTKRHVSFQIFMTDSMSTTPVGMRDHTGLIQPAGKEEADRLSGWTQVGMLSPRRKHRDNNRPAQITPRPHPRRCRAIWGLQRASVWFCGKGRGWPESDIDFLVEMERGRSLLDLIRLSQELEELLQRKVDILTYGGLSPYLEQRIHAEAVPL